MTHPTTSSLPPGPRLPRWVQTLGFILAPAPFVEACHRRYGAMVRFHSSFDPQFVILFDPELVKQLFRGSPEQLRAGGNPLLLPPIRAALGTRSVTALHGAEHLRRRKLLLPPFHGERMRAYEAAMREAADRAIDSWPVGKPFALLASMQSFTLDVIMRAVFGIDAGPRQEELERQLRAMIDPAPRRLRALLVALVGRFGSAERKRFEERRRLVDELIYDEIARRRIAPDLNQREDVLSMLLRARGEDGKAMTDQELRDELVTLLVAGHETTSTAIAWAFELLLHNPPVFERLRAELAVGDDGYLRAVIKETLRVRSVISEVGRVVREQPFELGGYLIPPGTEINPSIAAIHRRADLYPDPRAFRPERFLGPDPPDTSAWVPFGGGTRRCPGASFAMFEMAVMIRRVVERASLSPGPGKPEKGVRKRIAFAPERGVRVVQWEAPRPAAAPDGAERSPFAAQR